MQQETLILLAATTGYQTRSFAAAAARHGVNLVLATDRCHVLENPWADKAIAIQFENEQAGMEAIHQAMQHSGHMATGIVAVADKPTVIAALTAQRLGLNFHPPAATRICRDKHQLRNAFRDAGLLVPNYYLAKNTDRATYPCVLKPLGLSGSRGVIRANNPAEAKAAFEQIRNLGEHEIQIEDYIPGREFAVEGLLTKGELQVLAIFDKPDPLEGPFFEETIYVTPSRETLESQVAMVEAAGKAAKAIGLTDGPMHAEMRVNDQGVWMLEVAARPIGGLCARALQFDRGNLEELVILHALGRMPQNIAPLTPASGVMMIPVPRAGILGGVDGTEDARAVPGITDVIVTAKLGERLIPLPEGASYTGFLFAQGQTPAAVEHALRTAHAKVRFEILTALPVL